MSNNLFKYQNTTLQHDGKRVIDTNDLVAKRIEELSAKMRQPENEGFVSGLNAPDIELETLLTDEGEALQNNVIKAGEEATNILTKARQEAGSVIDAAKTEAERIIAKAKSSAETEVSQMLSAAREQGFLEGMQKAEKEAEKQRMQFEEKERQLQADYQRQIEELEPEFINVITGIYEHIFHVELDSYREILVYLISSTMRKIEGVRSYMIHVSEEDYPYVSMEKKQLMVSTAAPGMVVEILEDLTLSRNECLIETENGIFDCGLGTQLSELTQKLRLLSYERSEK